MWESWLTIDFKEMNLLLARCHPEHEYQFLNTIWISDKSNCFRLFKNVAALKEGKLNPRITNEIHFKATKEKVGENLASEVIRCKGTFNCTLNASNQCPVKMKIIYIKGGKVNLLLESNNHGIHFKPVLNRLKVANIVRVKIAKNDQKMNSMGKYGTTPALGNFI